MKELFEGTDKCTTHSYCQFYEDVLGALPEDPVILNISSTPDIDAKALLEAIPEASVWCLTENRDGALGAIRAGAKALCTNVHDVRGMNDWLGVQQFDLIIDDGSHTAIDQFRTVLIGHKRLKKYGKLIIEDVQDNHIADLLGGHLEDFTKVKNRNDDRIVWFSKQEPLPKPFTAKDSVETVVLTPTGDRPLQLMTVIECMSRQSKKPDLWIIMDDGTRTVPEYYFRLADCPVQIIKAPHMSGHSRSRNMAMLLEAVPHTAKYCIVFEDDDYYPDRYLEQAIQELHTHAAIGTRSRKYYRFSDSSYHIFHNNTVCLRSMAFRSSEIKNILPAIKDSDASNVDIRIWPKFSESAVVDYKEQTPIGGKAWPFGRAGTTSEHRNNKYTKDPEHNTLYTLISKPIADRYLALCAPAASVDTVDVVLPLGNGSRSNNDELRLCLRSIERFMPSVGNVWLLTSYAPDWVRNVEVVDIPDKHRHNKDANLFDKVLSAATNPRVSKTFVFFSDDQCLIAPFDPFTAQIVYNTRGPEAFTTSGTWHRRMTHTFEYLKSHGIELDYNFDGHVPMVYTKEEFVKALKGVDYVPEPGFCINTLVCGILRKPKEVAMSTVKVTAESGGERKLDDKLYVGYNDTGFSGGMRDALFKAFPIKSKYEA